MDINKAFKIAFYLNFFSLIAACLLSKFWPAEHGATCVFGFVYAQDIFNIFYLMYGFFGLAYSFILSTIVFKMFSPKDITYKTMFLYICCLTISNLMPILAIYLTFSNMFK